ncbi:MAG: chromosome segregation protein SMC, partial [Defluviitaleaceae bacterium]|nr:chromosome segregation protein SMC [Defluviitaleaceae bacterium]
EASLSEQESIYENYQKEIMAHSQKVSAKWAELQQQEATVKTLEANQKRLNEAKITVDMDGYKSKQQELADALASHAQKEKELTQEIDNYSQAHSQLIEKGAALRNKIQSTQQEHHAAVSRHKLLSEMARDYGGYYASVKSVLKKKDTDSIFGKGIFGTAGDLITIPQSYEHALSVALGASSQNIITATEADAQRAITYLKSSKAGRATFLPISAMKARIITSEMDKLLIEPGVIGLAGKLISFDPIYAPVFGYLLGNVFVVEHLNRAIALSKKYRQSYRLVTLEGDLISPGGAMTGGSQGRQSTELLGRNREINELADKVSTYKSQINYLEQEQQTHITKEKEIEQQLANLRQKFQTIAIEKNNCQNLVYNNESGIKHLQQQLSALEQEKNQVITNLNQSRQRIIELQGECIRENQAIKNIQKSQEDHRQQQIDNRKLREDAMALLTEHKIQLSKLTQSLQTTQFGISRIVDELDSLKKEEVSLKTELDKLSESSSYNSELAQKRLEDLRAELEKQQTNLSDIEERISQIKSVTAKLEAEHKDNMEVLSRLNRESDRLESRFEQIETESRRLHNEIWDSYSLTFQSAQDFRNSEYTGAALRREEKRLKTEITSLGNVNVGAIEAYQVLRQRHDFLTSQRDDILEAEAQLQELIRELTEQMEQQFIVQFKLIAKNFNDVFQEMFGGGKAGLVMSDPDHVLESGIEITAQPPGKNLQSMSLLSGGERALTAIALLFGILRMKPSPFCILDEIEASLDDANVNRFAEFLKVYAGDTQFIVITHRKGTMECADTLYGVTMQEMGISKMVSVNFS